ncbi:hypothetical protein QBC36DRAFT_360294 [Triangularia setosa]|uniref:Uncharacterized protein n=1 Tax=Triangularia setosa TaxID=2587417 RepID=A0AAN6W1R7_9PEZI|nr:hypothetical protein QBC36DRAFT_360294 [Podospora setosa]
MCTKKSLKKHIRDAKAIIDLPPDQKLYPKIQGLDKQFYHLRAHFKLKDGERLGANTAGKRSSLAIDELFRTTKKAKLPPPAKTQGRFQELLFCTWVAG